MRKFISTLAAIVMLFSVIHLPEAKAASAIKIVIDGQVLSTDQAPVAIAGYTFVPLRGIFEALNARVQWNQKAQTVTATKRDTTIVLRIGASTATINNQTVTLDAPARAIGGRTMVPVRFVSEALGDDVLWDKSTQSVIITTKAVKQVGAVSSVAVSTVPQYGDGRDLQVNFTPPSDQSNVDSYRILVVKAENASAFNLAKAQTVSSLNYAFVSKSNAYSKISLTEQSRDVDGALLRTNQAYKVFVLTAGQDTYALSSSSVSISLSASPSVSAVTNVKIDDVGDFGDGRDLQVSFTKASNESNITGYRVMIVKSSQASSFNLTTANGMSSSYYSTVSKTNANTLTYTFNSSSRDTSGDTLRNGVAYTAFVLSVSSNTGTTKHGLSAGSASVTLGASAQVATITNVEDVDNYGDARDLKVSFNKAADESRISAYRIFVVRESDYSSFNLTEANKVSSASYSDQYRTGNSNYSVTLPSSLRDTKGRYIESGVAYRVFVMGVSSNSSYYPNTLSSPSRSISLVDNGVMAVTNVYGRDVADTNSGQDLRVTFTKAYNETKIGQYRVFVVREGNASNFTLATAVAMNNYTVVNKTGVDISLELTAASRDTSGVLIQAGVSYRIFVLSVGAGTSYGTNALSSASPAITLANTGVVTAVTNLYAYDATDYNDSRDLRVTFTKASNESNIDHYRVFVVRNEHVNNFNLNTANSISDSRNYSNIPKKAADIDTTLPAGVRDIYGQPIVNGVDYRIFVLSVGYGVSYGTNVLSAPSPVVRLTNTGTVTAVSNVTASDVSDNNNGSDMFVSFNKAAVESNISQYRIFVVKDITAGTFDLTKAIANGNYTSVIPRNSNINMPLTSSTLDVDGMQVQNNTPYRVFVLSVGGGAYAGTNVLSLASPAITLTSPILPVPPVTSLGLFDVGDTNTASDLQVSYTKAGDESGIDSYRIFVVEENDARSFNLSWATGVVAGLYTAMPTGTDFNLPLSSAMKDVRGADIQNGKSYRVFVLSVGKNAMNSTLSAPSNPVPLASPPPLV
ncbi:copper amine oxidase N-terminal domain-containing protein [Cohnella herbarum]|uniref:Copper amine oxidase N-terminal domain-containing protein n=1 Tax=Cohnella herbarum TaxID=2728023 RepID=A0A7Z2VN56_9BACL|nr:copper amine oxidase N-terminal domain-containing protein [Cohnella herbarum]QJD86086.1 copper amine oxidase N-terminal domain-containing protein [Cohnella herbarum]